jgi:hypothetical protein
MVCHIRFARSADAAAFAERFAAIVRAGGTGLCAGESNRVASAARTTLAEETPC